MMKEKRAGNTSEYKRLTKEHRKNSKRIDAMDEELKRRRGNEEPIRISAGSGIDWSESVTQPTTTYERARRRRKREFDAWFFGSQRK